MNEDLKHGLNELSVSPRDNPDMNPFRRTVPGDTPLVHSTLLEMIGFAATGRCMACGWPLKASADQGCVQGNCSFRPGEHNPEYPRWWQRTQILTLARKYLSGELGKNSNLCDVQDATAGEG